MGIPSVTVVTRDHQTRAADVRSAQESECHGLHPIVGELAGDLLHAEATPARVS